MMTRMLLPLYLLAGTFQLALAAVVTGKRATTDSQYDYIVVGSGAGGGPLACRLAMAGFKTLLIEAGNDQGSNVNTTVPGYQAAVTQDPALRWDIFVNHYQDQTRAQQDPKYTWQTGPYQYHVGPNPPAGATPKGILYPRAQALGGCVSHNALIWITPHASDWNNIATITGDNSWSAANMNQYLDKVYEWLPTEPTDPTILASDLMLTQHLVGGQNAAFRCAAAVGLGPDPLNAVTALAGTLLVDPNSRVNPARDSTQGFFQIPLIMKNGVRTAVRDFIVSTVAAGHPLTVVQNRFVTKIVFDKSGATPKAVGVEFLDGEYLYTASPRSGGKGTPGAVNATREVILSGGTYNTVQLLKLSGIGSQSELSSLSIPVVKNLPGVGTNMQDRYEIPVNVVHNNDFPVLNGCTFDSKPHDVCLTRWKNNPFILSAKGAYATNGLAATMLVRSATADDTNDDLAIFGGPVDFTGYFPQWGDAAVADHKHFSWYTLKAHTRNKAGTVQLRSTNPLDTPLINFNYFDTGTTADGADQKDVAAMVQAIKLSRKALQEYSTYSILGGTPFVEQQPGPEVQSDADIGNYIKQRAWGHHACCTNKIGADSDSQAVLDSQFRVRGVQGLRVVDASIFPSIPGVFIQAPIFMISEKAADVIIQGTKTTRKGKRGEEGRMRRKREERSRWWKEGGWGESGWGMI
ncbi:GMC oxidoreductase [Myriangium duriaei CBS 260.36]|uniref:GMC oxidoreductase n=1 Tax=Myriangium duriaei CBS 260.36 TaxID=1168546 RepID=A0A9P4MEU5_9PEZI|nr:GMC oxidoreductase [Myriangium duriaei CBS 260.36]